MVAAPEVFRPNALSPDIVDLHKMSIMSSDFGWIKGRVISEGT
jgi:hypothetical protein